MTAMAASLVNTHSNSGGEAIARHLAEKPAFVGISYATAGRLWRRFGADLYRALGDRDVAALTTVLATSEPRS